jgi:prophage DNA circulation protein
MALNDIINSISNISNPYGAPSKGTWNLQRCIFQQLSNGNVQKSVVLFFEQRGAAASSGQIAENIQSITALDQVADAGGRRLAIYEYPYQDGQELSDMGRKGEVFTFNLKFWGLQYQERFNDFIENVTKYSGDAQIIHPVRGVFPVKFQNWDFVHRFDEWNAVTIKAVFMEDNSVQLQSLNGTAQTTAKSTSIDQSIRNSLSKLTQYQSAVQSALFDATAILLLPKAIQNALSQRLTSITNAVAGFQAQLAATFSNNATINTLGAQAASAGVSLINLSSGTVPNAGSTTTSNLPPVLQVGYDPATTALIQSQLSSFLNANQITTQQAVFSANQQRAAISVAIAEAEANLGIYSFDVVFNYRQIAVMIQDVTETCISQAVTQIISYTPIIPMSLRQIAFANGLAPDRQNDIEALNPSLPSVNRVEAGTTVLVPAS